MDTDDGSAIFKVRILSATKSDDSNRQLLAAAGRGGDLGMHAALALAARGDSAAKPVLMKNVERMFSKDSRYLELLCPLLKPGDYDEMYQLMLDSKAKRKQEQEEGRERYRQTLDPNAEGFNKETAERELKRWKWDEAWFLIEWVPLLGATGNVKGRPLYLSLLEDPSARLRAVAVNALAGVYDDAVGDALAKRLGTEEIRPVEAIIMAMGYAKDKRHIEQLMAVVQEPTLVSTKLAWIDVMMELAPEKALPIIRTWADSPDAYLSAACKEAMATKAK